MGNEWIVRKGKNEQSIREEVMNAMKDFRHTPDIVGFNYEDLCRHPHLEIPGGFKYKSLIHLVELRILWPI